MYSPAALQDICEHEDPVFCKSIWKRPPPKCFLEGIAFCDTIEVT